MPHAVAYVHAFLPTHMAGAETTLHDALRALVEAGWTVEVRLSKPQPPLTSPYILDGVEVYPFSHRRDIIPAIAKADLAISHLESTERTVLLGRMHKVPVAQMMHNEMWQTAGYLGLGCDYAVYNTYWVRESILNQLEGGVSLIASATGVSARPSRPLEGPETILHPAVDAELYRRDAGSHDHVTLINLWENKGPDIFYRLAEAFPQVKFLGVKGGYGAQDVRDLPNVEIIENTPNVADEVYSRTKVLLVPSKYESFGRVAVEAAASGIPAITTPTPGLREAMGVGGLYAELDDFGRWKATLHRLLSDKEVYNDAQWYARDRSAYWMKERANELQDFVQLAEAVIQDYKERS